MTIRERFGLLRRAFRSFDRRGTLLLFILRNFRRPPAEIFRGAWRIVGGSEPRRGITDRFGVPEKHVRHYRLRRAMKLAFPSFVPTVTFDREMLELMRRTPTVIASIHARTEFAMCAALDQAGLRSAIITAFAVKPAEMQNYDLSTPPQNILRDRDVFVKAAAALRSGKVVVCDVDFIIDKDLPTARVCISPSLFEFARMVNATVFFGYTQISDDGDMHCIFRPAPFSSISSAKDAENFIAFIQEVQSELTELAIGDWAWPATSSAR